MSSIQSNEHFGGQWRSSANHKVKYTELFPQALLTMTELPDNSLANGKATRIEIVFDITDSGSSTFTCRDNGVGIIDMKKLNRFLTVGSNASSDAYHQYGYGRMAALSKFMPDYESAEWCAKFKFMNGFQQVSSPWNTSELMRDSMIPIIVDDTNRDIGFEWTLKFDASILGEELSDIKNLFAKIKERLTTKYHERIFDRTEFILTVKNGDQIKTESSKANKWKTLEQTIKEHNKKSPKTCCLNCEFEEKYMSIKFNYSEYIVKEPIAPELINNFPTYLSCRSISNQRVFISNDDRLIEARYKPDMDEKTGHGKQNGIIAFLNSNSDEGDYRHLPESSTIKVTFIDGCVNLAGIYKLCIEKKAADKKKAADTKKAASKKTAATKRAVSEKAVEEKAPEEKAVQEKATEEKAMVKPSKKDVTNCEEDECVGEIKHPDVSIPAGNLAAHARDECVGCCAEESLLSSSASSTKEAEWNNNKVKKLLADVFALIHEKCIFETSEEIDSIKRKIMNEYNIV